MVAPNPLGGAWGCQNLITDGNHQFATWPTSAGGLRIGRIHRDTQRWGVDHDQYQVGGTPATTLALPLTDDEHNYPVIAIDGNGRIHVWANMHFNTLRYIVSTDPHTADTWMSDSGWSTGTLPTVAGAGEFTYPTPVRLADGSMWLYFRGEGTSGAADSFYWTRTPTGSSWSGPTKLFQGLLVPDAGGPGIPGGDGGLPGFPGGAGPDTIIDWSAYLLLPVVESPRGPNPGRLHMAWHWSSGEPGPTNHFNGYGYSDDGGVTWRAVDGSLWELPITPLNNVALRIPGSAQIRSISRTSGIVIAVLDALVADVGIAAGNTVEVHCEDTGYDGTFTVAVVGGALGPNGVAWGQAGGNDPSGGVGDINLWPAVSGGALAIDDDGLPHMLWTTDKLHVHRDPTNTSWIIDDPPSNLGGVNTVGRFGSAAWLRGQLWGICLAGALPDLRSQMFQVTGTDHPTFRMSGRVGNGWDVSHHDPEAWRRFGSIEVLTPNGDRPRVFTFGAGARVRNQEAA